MTKIIWRASAWMGFVAIAASPRLVSAQENADSVETSVSDGYRAGHGLSVSEELLLHPRLLLEGGFQSNVFYTDTTDSGGEAGSPLLRVGVGASLVNAKPDADPGDFLLTGDVQLTWNQYLSGEDTISSRSDMGVAASVDASFNPKGSLAFAIRDTFARVVNPPPAEFAEDVDRDKNTLAATLTTRPGGGAIDIYAEASWTIDFFESEAFKFANRNTFTIKGGTRWQWLPKTQVNAEVSLGLVLVDGDAVRVDTGNSMPLRVLVGLSTLITSKFGTVVKIGYGNTFQTGGFNNFLALGELRYAFDPSFKVAAGYSHDFADSLLGNFREDHMLYFRFGAKIQERVEFTGRAETRFRTYSGIPMMAQGAMFCANMACTSSERSDFMLRLSIGGHYRLNEWLQVGGEFTQQSVSTDAFVASATDTDSFAFSWSEFLVNARATF